MYTKLLAILLLTLEIESESTQQRRYDNYSLINVIPTEQDQLKFLINLKSNKYLDVIFWKGPAKLFEDVHFIVNPKDLNDLMERTKHFNLPTTILQQDIQSLFEKQITPKSDKFNWDYYHSLEDIYQWLYDLASTYPKLVELTVIGKSAEGRDINAVIIKRQNAKQKVMIEGGAHGNEWLSVEFTLYLINQLVGNSYNSAMPELSIKYHWYIIPIVNPDGFVYSHLVDRMWRKNRRILETGIGVDLNRNFDYSFGTYGTSNNENDDTYCGPHPVSESETRAVSEFVSNHRNNLRFYFSFHSYGQKIVIPYGDRIKHIDNYVEMENFGRQAVYRMYRKSGVKYSVGTMYDTLGMRLSGNSACWVKKTFNVRYVFTFLLRDNGTYGHALPPELIKPTCEETIVGLAEIMTARLKRLSNIEMFGNTSNISGNFAIIFILVIVSIL